MRRLTRHSHPAPAWPVRSVHLGLGAFHRAHQAWYHAAAGDGWGIAAVSPRSSDVVGRLGDQDGLYTLVVRRVTGDATEVVGSISQVLGGADPAWAQHLARPEVGVVTLTVTEAGYRPDSALLAALVAGLDARRRAGGGALALVSCDNLSGNGSVLEAAVKACAQHTDPGLVAFIDEVCTFPSTVVDRITPAPTGADVADVARITGWDDRAPVVTEAWHEWVLEDRFPGGRPAWERGGAAFVTDVAPWERRKLRVLNAGHSLLAYEGAPRGHRWVHEAVADPVVLGRLRDLWAEAVTYLEAVPGSSWAGYTEAVEARWANDRLPHALAQIGADGSLKLAQRVVPTVRAARSCGVLPVASVELLGAWMAHLRSPSFPLGERTDGPVRAAAGAWPDAARRVLDLLDAGSGGDVGLGHDAELVRAVAAAAAQPGAGASRR
jgi:fructuronate reductase